MSMSTRSHKFGRQQANYTADDDDDSDNDGAAGYAAFMAGGAGNAGIRCRISISIVVASPASIVLLPRVQLISLRLTS